jgi:hypothetical protein
MITISRCIPALVLLTGVSLAAPACAEQTYGYGYPRGGYARDVERRAYDNGYREGLEEGRNDGRHNRNYSYERHSEFRDADDGYHRGDGDRELYRHAYRHGFQAGYNEAYSRNARNSRGVYPPYQTYPAYPTYPSNRGGYGSIARDNGYRQGVDAGRRDARDGERFDPVRAMKRYYRDDSSYDNRYGSRDDYKRDYGAAFEQGYREGYGQRR